MRRLAALAALAACLAGTAPAGAHDPARLDVTSPTEGQQVTGTTVRVVVVGRGGTAAAAFRLELDGQAVDATGRVGGVFSTLSVAPGAELVLTVPVTPGTHTLSAIPNPDADSRPVTVTRRFTVLAKDETPPGGTAGGADAVPVIPLAAAAAVAGAVAVGVVARRRRDQGGTG